MARGEVVAVGARERLGVALEERPGALLAELLEEGLAEVVAPGAGGRGEARLDLGDVDVGDASGRREDHVVQAREHRLGHPRREVDVRAREGLLQDLVDPPAVRRVEALAREVDEAGDEAAEGVAPDEQPHPLPLAEMEDAERDLEQLVLGHLEELVARVRLDDLDECLVVVAPGAAGPSARRRAGPCAAAPGSPTGSRCRRYACRGRGSGARRPPRPPRRSASRRRSRGTRAGARSRASSPSSG